MLVDTHIHVDAAEFERDREVVLGAARAAGVERFVVPSVDIGNFDRVAVLAATHPDIRPAYGIHPLYVERAAESDLEILADRLANDGALAVGEIGLDFHAHHPDARLQERFYIAQLKLAQRFALPVILHVRGAVDAILKQLRRVDVPGGIAHAFNGSRQQADMLIGMGFKLGFGGTMTFDGSRRIRELAARLPLDALVLETDAPDIPPVWARGERNEPVNLRRYAEILADLRRMSAADVIAATGENARCVFGDAL
ncbi:MAG: TatD family hydrolase [Aromatoleum sp.]|jgi:TatD DNase family protein|uniref:TatD family hydrolase n=1 Tax=Aromatoleum sp. TaxID=2307007 RepID=UPI0028952917|nr:TatD family hydrolase [Aromatoleum sp.]MDT3671599.1 TatD family hydrolase [Aromatoleum sp.]